MKLTSSGDVLAAVGLFLLVAAHRGSTAGLMTFASGVGFFVALMLWGL